MNDSTCPSDAVLVALSVGELPASDLEPLIPHLESCADCQRRLEALDGRANPVVDALRDSSLSPDGRPAEPPATLPTELAMPARLPERIGVYLILGELGSGGMGIVYKAWQEPLCRLVALKMMLTGRLADATRRARFRTEAQAVARLQHPNIVQVFEVGEHDGLPYFTLEYVDGGSLVEHVAGRPQPPLQAAAWVEELARAVHYAHQSGVVHRDLKPANILRTSAGVLKIADFGLAKLLKGAAYETRSGEFLGTPEYMAPEAAAGNQTGPAADVYSLGAVLYCLLTGRPPFQAPTVLETLMQLRHDQPVSLRRLQPKVPRDLETVCLKCLEKTPRRRYASALDLADELRRVLDGRPTRARPVGLLGRTVRWVRRRPAVAALAAALVLVTVAGFAAVSWQWRAEVVARRDAERLAGSLSLDEAISLCERGDPAGPLALVRSLEEVTRLGDADLERVVRVNLAGWLPRIYRRVRSYGVKETTGWVWRLALDPTGRTLATANYADKAQLWDVASGRRLGVLRPPGHVWSVAISPDGKTVLTGSGEPYGEKNPEKLWGEVQRWDLAERKPLGAALRHRAAVKMVAFRPPEGRTFLSVCANVARLWSTDTGEPLDSPMAHPLNIQTAAFSPNGHVLATAASDGEVRFWDAQSGRQYRETLSHPGRVLAVAFSPDGKRLATGTATPDLEHGEARVWTLDPDQKPGEWGLHAAKLVTGPIAHPDVVRSVAFGWNGRLLVSGSQDGKVRFFDVLSGFAVVPPHPLTTIQEQLPTRDGRAVFLGTVADFPGAWRMTLPGPMNLALCLPTDKRIWTIAFSPDSRMVGTCGDAEEVTDWELPSGRPLARPLRHPGHHVWALAFSPDGSQVVTGSKDGTCKLWDLKSGRMLQETRHPATVVCLSFSPDGRRFAAGYRDGSVRVWDTGGKSADYVLRHTDSVEWTAFTRDGALLTAGMDGWLRKWDTDTGALLYESRESGPILGGGLGPDGLLAATVVRDRPLRLWDAQTGKPREDRLTHRTGPLCAAAFSSDGHTLATAGSDHVVRLWDLSTGKPLGPPLPHPDKVFRVVFTPDGRHVATTCEDRQLRLWEVDSPLAGTVEAIRLRIEAAAGLELGPSGEVRELDEDAIAERRRRLEAIAQ